tara:strand:- start:5 stop:430 length:426 start_codon:yes stop_codon:yes gene_type:complete
MVWNGHAGLPAGYGDATQTETPSLFSESDIAQLTAAAPAISELISGSMDATQRKEVLQARLKNLRRMKRKFPLLTLYYENQIERTKAKLSAAKKREQLQVEAQESTRTWRGLGQTGVGVAVVLGIVLTGAIAIGAVSKATR